ncbi:MAG TPA: hypothetical protein ENG22_00080 [Candidatus Bathyarchaeota archaeon]|nr:hypothetical protein [Candidatus Bathyarchaeota archaeon]
MRRNYLRMLLKLLREKKLLEKYKGKFKVVPEASLNKLGEVVLEKRVKKYVTDTGKVIWVVVGKERDYYVKPNEYCTCRDFFLNVVIRKKRKWCYHMLAVEVAIDLGFFEEIKLSEDELLAVAEEWMKV